MTQPTLAECTCDHHHQPVLVGYDEPYAAALVYSERPELSGPEFLGIYITASAVSAA